MKIRLTFTSGIKPAVQEFETDLEPVPFLEKLYGTSVAFGNMGGTFEVLEPNPEPVVETPAEPAPELVPDAMIVPVEESADAKQEPEAA